MGKSAQVIDGKRVAMAPLCERVRNRMKTKRMKEDADYAGFAGQRRWDGRRTLKKEILSERLGTLYGLGPKD